MNWRHEHVVESGVEEEVSIMVVIREHSVADRIGRLGLVFKLTIYYE